MKKLRIKQAIAAGTWYDCRTKVFDESLHFRLRILGFEQSSVEELAPSNEHEVTVEGVLWLLFLEVVNLRKTPTSPEEFRGVSRIIDGDGFEFPAFESMLDEDERSPLYRFSVYSCSRPLSPKIKATGAIPFVLPDEENEYYFALKDGNITEA